MDSVEVAVVTAAEEHVIVRYTALKSIIGLNIYIKQP